MVPVLIDAAVANIPFQAINIRRQSNRPSFLILQSCPLAPKYRANCHFSPLRGHFFVQADSRSLNMYTMCWAEQDGGKVVGTGSVIFMPCIRAKLAKTLHHGLIPVVTNYNRTPRTYLYQFHLTQHLLPGAPSVRPQKLTQKNIRPQL